MNKTEAINKIKKLLNFDETIAKEEVIVNFLDLVDNQGVKLRTNSDGINVGDILSQIDENGVETIAKEGDYTLEDGSVITVDVDGVIADYVVANAMSEVSNTKVEDTKVEDTKVEDTKVEDTKVEDTEKRISDLELIIKELISKQEKQLDATMSIITLVEKIGDMPVDDKIVKLKNDFSSTNNEKSNDLIDIRKMRTKK